MDDICDNNYSVTVGRPSGSKNWEKEKHFEQLKLKKAFGEVAHFSNILKHLNIAVFKHRLNLPQM